MDRNNYQIYFYFKYVSQPMSNRINSILNVPLLKIFVIILNWESNPKYLIFLKNDPTKWSINLSMTNTNLPNYTLNQNLISN